jgi:hypothetical protein
MGRCASFFGAGALGQFVGRRPPTGGGAFHRVNPKDMKFLKWTEGAFKDWGSCGACANGSVTFLARVPLWFYAEPNPKYGNYTTETYRKFYLNKRMDTEKGNLYQSFDIAFRNETDFRQFLEDYSGRCRLSKASQPTKITNTKY